MTITQTFVRGPAWHVRNQGNFGRRNNHCAITHSSHLRIASGPATLFALPVCWFLITPRSVREVPLRPTRTSAKLLPLPQKWMSHWGGFEAFRSSTKFLLRQALWSAAASELFWNCFETQAVEVGDGRGITPAPASRTNRHSPNYSPAWRKEADRLLAGAQLAHCHGAVLRGRNNKGSSSTEREKTADTEMGGSWPRRWAQRVGATGALPVLG